MPVYTPRPRTGRALAALALAAAAAGLFAGPLAAQTATPGEAPAMPPAGKMPPKTSPKTSPMTPPPMELPEKVRCVFDRSWHCRPNGCLLGSERPVTVVIDTKAKTACQMRGNGCGTAMPFSLHRQRGAFSGYIARQGIIFRVDRRLRAAVARIRGSRTFAVYGRCQPAT